MIVGLANHTLLIRKDKTEVAISDSGAPIRNKDGKTAGVVLVFRDITSRRKAEEALTKQASLIELSPDAIIVKKLDDTITFWSKGAQSLYGWTKEEAVGQKTRVLLKTKHPEPYEEILNQLEHKGFWAGEKIQKTKSGCEVIVNSRWLTSGNVAGQIEEILETNVDVTERKKAEETLGEYNKNLEKLVEERTRQLKDSERLATIGATAGIVGHDIRNPLQAIVGDLYLAREEVADMQNDERKQAMNDSLAEIEKNVDYINKIVADLQDFARPLKPNVEETDLKRVIDDLLTKNGLPENVEVSVKVEPEKVLADSTFINRIMYNLVNNAVQAMPNGGKLTIHSYKEANDTVIIVKDTGIGISDAVKGKLFTPMFTTKAKGQGFGLSVIKRMTDALGGTVSFESQEGKGTTFIIRLPQGNKR
jgi:PAS domain S-box-containing protein